MAFWFNGRNSLKKTQYYVWYLGSKECDGLRGNEFVLPAMRQLLKESFRRFPNKVTVQVSNKGLKLIQTVPTFGKKSGKLKMEVTKFHVGANSLTFSTVGSPPFNDIVACILLVFNPETKSPVHVHCYRCDSAETALLMNSNIQNLLSRPDHQKHIDLIEHRLIVGGLLLPKRNNFRDPLSPTEFLSSRHLDRSVAFCGKTDKSHLEKSASPQFLKSDDFEYVGMSSDDDNNTTTSSEKAKARLKESLFHELKNKLTKGPVLMPAKDYSPDALRKRRSIAMEYNDDFVCSSPEGDWKKATCRDDSHTSSTSGLGSDMSSSRGRFRFSIAEIPSWADSDRDISPVERSPEFDDQMINDSMHSPHKQRKHRYQSKMNDKMHCVNGKALRMFGDTLLIKEQKANKFTPDRNIPSRYRSPDRPAWNRRSRLHRSMDNLHLQSDKVTSVPNPSFEKSSNLKNDGFWKDRAKRSSWFLPPDAGLFPFT